MKKVLLAIEYEEELPFEGPPSWMLFPALMSDKYVYAKVSKEKLLLTAGEYIKVRRFNAPDITKDFRWCGLKIPVRKIFASNFGTLYGNIVTLPMSCDKALERDVCKQLDELDGGIAEDILGCLSELSGAHAYLNMLQDVYADEELRASFNF